MADGGNVPISGKVCAARMRTIFTRNRTNPVNSNCGNRPISVCRSMNLFKNSLCAPDRSSSGLTNIKFSEFHCASITSGTIITTQETASYYKDKDNGSIRIFVDPDTIVTGSDDKKGFTFIYGNTTCEKSALASDAAALEAARKHTFSGFNTGNYRVCFKDELTDSLINKVVNISYNGGNRTYNCIQKTNDSA